MASSIKCVSKQIKEISLWKLKIMANIAKKLEINNLLVSFKYLAKVIAS
jgi:hypothetical protein